MIPLRNAFNWGGRGLSTARGGNKGQVRDSGGKKAIAVKRGWMREDTGESGGLGQGYESRRRVNSDCREASGVATERRGDIKVGACGDQHEYLQGG